MIALIFLIDTIASARSLPSLSGFAQLVVYCLHMFCIFSFEATVRAEVRISFGLICDLGSEANLLGFEFIVGFAVRTWSWLFISNISIGATIVFESRPKPKSPVQDRGTLHAMQYHPCIC